MKKITFAVLVLVVAGCARVETPSPAVPAVYTYDYDGYECSSDDFGYQEKYAYDYSYEWVDYYQHPE